MLKSAAAYASILCLTLSCAYQREIGMVSAASVTTVSTAAVSTATVSTATASPAAIASSSRFKSEDLCSVAASTVSYIRSKPNDAYAVHDGNASWFEASVKRVSETLEFICRVVEEDEGNKRQSRLHDPQFLEQNFDFFLWRPDKTAADAIAGKSTNKIKTEKLQNIPNEKLLLTKYYVKKLNGSPIKTDQFSQALYSLPKDESGLTQAQAERQRDSLTRYRFTRQEIIEGALEKDSLAAPLIWLSEEGLHDVLLQGTGVIDDGNTLRYFNVHRNNGIDYDYTIGMNEQARYWYFAEVNAVLGYGNELANKIPLKKHVAVAGNIEQVGLGKLFLIQYELGGVQTKHLAVLADEGGAFKDNLFQLDLLVGGYEGWADYYLDYKSTPDYARVWLMLKK